MPIFYHDVEDLASRILCVVTTATRLRDFIVSRHEPVFDKLFEKYGVTDNTNYYGSTVSCIMDGGCRVSAEYDPVNREWFPIKIRGEPDPTPEQKEKYIAFIKEMIAEGEILIGEMKRELYKIDMIYLNHGVAINSHSLHLFVKYDAHNIRGRAIIPLEINEPISFVAELA